MKLFSTSEVAKILNLPDSRIRSFVRAGFLAPARDKRKIAHCDEPAETHGQVLDRKNLRRAHAGVSVRASCTTAAGISLRSLRNTEGVRVETRPRGR